MIEDFVLVSVLKSQTVYTYNMGVCVARGCFNSSKKGFKMNKIPSDAHRKSVWCKNAKIEISQLNKNSALCEVIS